MYLNIQGPFHQTLAFVAISPSATRQALVSLQLQGPLVLEVLLFLLSHQLQLLFHLHPSQHLLFQFLLLGFLLVLCSHIVQRFTSLPDHSKLLQHCLVSRWNSPMKQFIPGVHCQVLFNKVNKQDFLQVFQGNGIGKIEYNLTSADPLSYTTTIMIPVRPGKLSQRLLTCKSQASYKHRNKHRISKFPTFL